MQVRVALAFVEARTGRDLTFLSNEFCCIKIKMALLIAKKIYSFHLQCCLSIIGASVDISLWLNVQWPFSANWSDNSNVYEKKHNLYIAIDHLKKVFQ